MSSNRQPGYPGRGRSGRGRGVRSAGRAYARQRGRPLNQSDTNVVLNIWFALNISGRQRLVETIHSLSASLPGGQVDTTPVERQEPPPPEDQKGETKHRKLRVWERSVLKDIPIFQEFAKKSTKERGADKDTSRLLSIVTGAVGRGTVLGLTEKEMLDHILVELASEDAPDLLRHLYSSPDVDVINDGVKEGTLVHFPEGLVRVQKNGFFPVPQDGLEESSEEEDSKRMAVASGQAEEDTPMQDADNIVVQGPSEDDVLKTQQEIDKATHAMLGTARASSDALTVVPAPVRKGASPSKTGNQRRSWGSECSSTGSQDGKPSPARKKPRSDSSSSRKDKKKDKKRKKDPS